MMTLRLLICLAGALAAALVWPTPVAAAPTPHPANAKNITVFALRPYNLSGTLDNKDSGDPLGDIFFYVSDRFQTRMACRHDPSWYMCKNLAALDRASVYGQYVVEVDADFGGCPAGTRNCSQYAACNPTDLSGNVWRCDPPTAAHVGVTAIQDRYPSPKGNTTFDHWKFAASKYFGGHWYSTLTAGDCGNPDAADCQWRLVRTLKTVNASCVNANLHRVLINENPDCFAPCGGDVASDCFVTCFMNTLFAKNATHTPESLAAAWLGGFEATDPTDPNYCPEMPPYVPPAAPAVR